MPLFLKSLDTDIDVFGNRQNFHFNDEDAPVYNTASLSIVNHFVPTSSLDIESSLDLLDKNLDGFRIVNKKTSSDTYGILALQKYSVFGNQENLLEYQETENKFLFGVPLDLGNNKITNVGSPTQNSDAANKEYVDNLSGIGIQSLAMNGNNGIQVTGSPVTTTSGNIDLSLNNVPINALNGYPASISSYLRGDGNWSNPLDVPLDIYSSSVYADISFFNSNNAATATGFRAINENTNNGVHFGMNNATNEGYVLCGSTVGLKFGTDDTTRMKINSDGSVNMYSNKITNLPSPTSDNDASTKKYVDDQIKIFADNEFLSWYAIFGLSSNSTDHTSIGDHVPFDQSFTSNDPNNIIMGQLTGAYDTTIGAFSLGRIKLLAGYIYKIEGYAKSLGTTTFYGYSLYDVTSGFAQRFGTRASGHAASNPSNNVDSMFSKGYVQATSDTIIEVRVTGGIVTEWEDGNFSRSGCWIDIQVIGKL